MTTRMRRLALALAALALVAACEPKPPNPKTTDIPGETVHA